MTELIWSFAPWLAFLLGFRVTSLYGAVAAGVTASAVVMIRAVSRRRVHLLDIAGLCYFLALGGILVTVHPAHLAFWSRYAQAGSHAALTLIVFGPTKTRPSLPVPKVSRCARSSCRRSGWIGTLRVSPAARCLS